MIDLCQGDLFSSKSSLPRNLNHSILMCDGQVKTKTQSRGRKNKKNWAASLLKHNIYPIHEISSIEGHKKTQPMPFPAKSLPLVVCGIKSLILQPCNNGGQELFLLLFLPSFLSFLSFFLSFLYSSLLYKLFGIPPQTTKLI